MVGFYPFKQQLRAFAEYPVLDTSIPREPIRFDPKYTTWPGKEEGKPCPPIMWYGEHSPKENGTDLK